MIGKIGRRPGSAMRLSPSEEQIVRERCGALEKVIQETWTTSHRGVELGGPVHFRHCNLSVEVSHHVQTARERVASTAPEGVRLAQALVNMLQGVADGSKSSVPREEMGRVYDSALKLLTKAGVIEGES